MPIIRYICEEISNLDKMLIEFSISNYRSIKSIQTISLRAAPIVSKNKDIDENNLATSVDVELLKSIAIYGANGSGKSNVIKGMLFMLNFIENSFADNNYIRRAQPFALDKISGNRPSYFQIMFILNKDVYRYGFEIKKYKVVSEWLYGPAKKNEVFYFHRENDIVTVNGTSFPEGIGLEKGKTKDSTLFVNVTDAFNGKISKSIKEFFKNKVKISIGLNDKEVRNITLEMLDSKSTYSTILDFIKSADFGISEVRNISINEKNLPTNSPQVVKQKVETDGKFELLMGVHNIYTQEGKLLKSIHHPFDLFESEGTKKYFNYAGVIISALSEGKTLIIDEFDSRLHPLLAKRIVQLFNSKDVNKSNAQLVFVTHDTNLLDSTLFRRDQIYFAEKNKKGESYFYSLVNIGGVRNDASYEKDYIKGKYGAIPFLGDFNIPL